VAVLAIDLTFSLALGQATSPAEAWTVTRRWEQAIADTVQAFGGVFLRRSPPLTVAAFGLPRALEQMPHRAVQAALAIRHLVEEARHAAEQEPSPEVRLAVHLGPVLVDAGSPDPVMRLPTVGDTLAVPMRLLGHAGPGEILASPRAAGLVEGVFALQARKLPLGADRPGLVTAYTIDGLTPPAPPERTRVRPRSRFVGRERELGTLHDLLADVEGRRGQVVCHASDPQTTSSPRKPDCRAVGAEQRGHPCGGRTGHPHQG
jgi:class 3 adenylate cyclase